MYKVFCWIFTILFIFLTWNLQLLTNLIFIIFWNITSGFCRLLLELWLSWSIETKYINKTEEGGSVDSGAKVTIIRLLVQSPLVAWISWALGPNLGVLVIYNDIYNIKEKKMFVVKMLERLLEKLQKQGWKN